MPKKSRIEPVHIPAGEWLKNEDHPRGVMEGKHLGIDCVVIRFSTDVVGDGPELHIHPYDEIFNVVNGRAEFTIGDKKFIASAGSLLIAPANVPHGYKNLGPGRLDNVDIHMNSEWIQYDLSEATQISLVPDED